MTHWQAPPTTKSFSLGHFLPIVGLATAIAVAYIPTFVKLAEGPWRSEQEGHGPLIIAAAVWLTWRCREKIGSATFSPAPIAGWTILLSGLAIMIVARSQDVLMIEFLSAIPVITGCIVLLAGLPVLRAVAFPIGLLVFAAPPPGWMLDAVTMPLKVLVSDWTTQILYSAGYPIAQNGVAIMISSYQVMVEDACAGMNSIYALSAVGLFYVYVFHPKAKVRSLILLASVLPIAIAANLLRVIALVLTAYYCGITKMEGVFHNLTGITVFILAIALMLLLDGILSVLITAFGKIRRIAERSFES
jgi:exosortase